MSTKTNVKIYSLISSLVCILSRREKRSVRTFDKYIYRFYVIMHAIFLKILNCGCITKLTTLSLSTQLLLLVGR